MSEADEMFEKIGYKLYEIESDGELIAQYEKTENKNEIVKRAVIRFWDDETVSKGTLETSFTMQELQAINKKCEELQWI